MDKDIYAPSVNLEGNDTTPKPESEHTGLSAHIIDFVQSLVLFGAIFAIIYLFVAQPHKVSGSSMVPTFINGDYILTDKISYRFGIPNHGDIIVLKNPKDETQDFIKRIIGLPGDTVRVSKGKVYVNGTQLSEAYLGNDIYTPDGNFMREGQDRIVPADSYLVFGDNREHSSDSRAWGFVTRKEIVGKVFFRYWPPNTFGIT
jgi:signal peptidase I